MENDLISIIVPLYNYAHYIEELIKSVQKQNYKKWELIIIDDFSDDRPLKIIKKYLNERIKYYRLEKNYGYAKAKNEGIIKSKGEYIVILDADDVLIRKSLLMRINFLKKTHFKWIHAKAYEFRNNIDKARWIRRKFVKRFEKMKRTKKYSRLWDSIHAQTVMAKRECYLKVGLYEESMRSMSDKEMWARLQYNIGIPGYLDKFVVYYRMHKKQMHRSKAKAKMVRKLTRKLKKCVKTRSKGNFVGVRKLEFKNEG